MNAASKARMGLKTLTMVAGGGYLVGKLVGGGRARVRGASTSARTATKGARRVATTRRARAGAGSRVAPVATGLAAGAAGAYFLDPDNGRRRRHIARDKALKHLRRGGREARRRADYAAGAAVGAVQEARPSDRDPARDLNDPALARKVESEIFRDQEAPKDTVDVNVEDGVVYLRGEVASPEQARKLIESARRVEGPRDVESLLHTPGEPPRSKDGSKQPTAS